MKKAVKITMPIYSAQMPTKAFMQKCENAKKHRADLSANRSRQNTAAGYTMVEIIIVIVILSLFVVMAQTNLLGILVRSSFKAEVQDFISTMQMAASAAAESDRRYEVIIDISEQSYLLRQITSSNIYDILEEEIIVYNDLGDDCRFDYVLFDDLVETDEDYQQASFRAGHAGWQNGGKIVLLDRNDQPYTVIVNRMNRIITLKRGDVEILLPKTEDEILF